MVKHTSPFRLTSASVGFIGASEELNPSQLARIRALLEGFGATELHHGGRLGPDVQVHALADELGLWRFVHPDDDIALRAAFGSDALYPVVSYDSSRAQIVDLSGALIAVPAADEQPQNGATWEIVRRAVAAGKPIVVVGHAGEVLRASPVVFGPTKLVAPW